MAPFDKHAVEVGLAACIAGFVHDCSDQFASVMCLSAAAMVRSLFNLVPTPAFQPRCTPNNDTLGERIELYVEENFPGA